jgi:hypothetical protein
MVRSLMVSWRQGLVWFRMVWMSDYVVVSGLGLWKLVVCYIALVIGQRGYKSECKQPYPARND